MGAETTYPLRALSGRRAAHVLAVWGLEAVGEFVPHPGQRGDPQSPGTQTAFALFVSLAEVLGVTSAFLLKWNLILEV